MSKSSTALAALALTVSAQAQAQAERPRSYYPTLTRADISICRAQFSALQADVVEHFRQSAADYAPGGEAYKMNPAGYADGANVRHYTARKNEIAVMDPLSFYIKGLMRDGEGVGGLDGINEYWDEDTASNWLTAAPDPRPISDLRFGLARPQVKAPAEKCVARVWTKKFQAMHAPPASSKNATAVPPLRPTVRGEAHNPAGEATDCLEGIFHPDFKAQGIKSNMEAVIRNKCARPVSVTWCIKGWDCKPGYSNLGSVPARDYMPVSFVYKGPTRMEFAACYNGFLPGQGELSKKLLHACK